MVLTDMESWMELPDEADFVPDYDEALDVSSVAAEVSPSNKNESSDTHSIIDMLASREHEDPSNELVKNKRSRKLCSVCKNRVSSPKSHVLQNHLPWYFNPHLACAICKVSEKAWCFVRDRHILTHDNPGHLSTETWCYLMCGLLTYLAQKLNLKDMFDLLPIVQSKGLCPQFQPNHHYFSQEETTMLQQFARKFNIDFNISLHPAVSILACFHWRVLSSLLLLLPTDQDRQFIRELYLPAVPSGASVDLLPSPTCPIKFIGSHFQHISCQCGLICRRGTLNDASCT
jgi:hypothetical protein